MQILQPFFIRGRLCCAYGRSEGLGLEVGLGGSGDVCMAPAEFCAVPLGTVQKITHKHHSVKFKQSACSHVLLTAQHHSSSPSLSSDGFEHGFPWA